MRQTFYSNGKLMLTGEYVVLDGAKAFALPTKFGQYLTVESSEKKGIYWTSFDSDGSVWFDTKISFESIISKEKIFENEMKNTLIEILHKAYQMNPDFIKEGYKIETRLTFPRNWGLGTSSTLINNLAQWLKIDAFELLQKSFGGSGYDIACAQNNSAVLYQLVDDKPRVNSIVFNPVFKDKIYFVYLNKKQNTKNSIKSYYGRHSRIENAIHTLNLITENIYLITEPKEFALAMLKHEIVMSDVLERATVKEVLFPDFDGVIKSLGAWGGDFVMSISKENPSDYFKSKGYETVISYEDMIL